MSRSLLARLWSRVGLETLSVAVLFGLCSSVPLLAQPPVGDQAVGDPFLGIAGLVVDNTRTVVGRRFFDALSAHLTDLQDQTSNVVVQELADPRFGSRLSIRVGERLVFRRFLSPRLGEIDDLVQVALSRIQKVWSEQRRVQQELEMF